MSIYVGASGTLGVGVAVCGTFTAGMGDESAKNVKSKNAKNTNNDK